MFRRLLALIVAALLLLGAVGVGAAAGTKALGEPGSPASLVQPEREPGSGDGSMPAEGRDAVLEVNQSALDGPGLVQSHDRGFNGRRLAYPLPGPAPSRLASPFLEGPQRPPRAVS